MRVRVEMRETGALSMPPLPLRGERQQRDGGTNRCAAATVQQVRAQQTDDPRARDILRAAKMRRAFCPMQER
jgi:hypothetical protein